MQNENQPTSSETPRSNPSRDNKNVSGQSESSRENARRFNSENTANQSSETGSNFSSNVDADIDEKGVAQESKNFSGTNKDRDQSRTPGKSGDDSLKH